MMIVLLLFLQKQNLREGEERVRRSVNPIPNPDPNPTQAPQMSLKEARSMTGQYFSEEKIFHFSSCSLPHTRPLQ